MDALPLEDVHPPGLGKGFPAPFYQADWEWLTNVPVRTFCEERHRIHVKGMVILGPPKASATHTTEQLEAMGFIGFYHRIFDLEAALKPAVVEQVLCSFCALSKPRFVRRDDIGGMGLCQCEDCYRCRGTGDPRGEHPLILLPEENDQGVIRG